jgi:hypothetical protein
MAGGAIIMAGGPAIIGGGITGPMPGGSGPRMSLNEPAPSDLPHAVDVDEEEATLFSINLDNLSVTDARSS